MLQHCNFPLVLSYIHRNKNFVKYFFLLRPKFNFTPSLIIKGLNCKIGKFVAIVISFPSHILLLMIKDTMTFYLCP